MKFISLLAFCSAFLLFSSPSSSAPTTKDRPRGLKNAETKIVGGTVVSPSFKYPWMVGLFYGTTTASGQFCGASVIDSTHVLTAGHCTWQTPTTDIYAQVHRHNLNVSPASESGQVRNVVKMILHPKYDPVGINNDVAIWVLDQPLDSVTPITLDRDGTGLTPGTSVRVMGWGTTTYEGNPSSLLLQVNLQIIDQSQCKAAYANVENAEITNVMLCSGTPTGGKDSCQGDSGGPLVINADTSPVQVGVVSFGIGCGEKDYPGINARVSELISFIDAALVDVTDNCQGVQCQNGGTCYDSIDTFVCGCPDHYYGVHCETNPSSKVIYTVFNIFVAILLALYLTL